MTDAGSRVRSFGASDGYPLHVRIWPASSPPRGQVVVLHGVQSHGGWYYRLGRTLASAATRPHFPIAGALAPTLWNEAMPIRRAG